MITSGEMLAWLSGGFSTVIPETFIVTAALAVVLTWAILRRLYQRCPLCRRVVHRAIAGTRRCRRCGRQYYRGLRHVG